jgi:triosephosphate isomerase (TIM)
MRNKLLVANWKMRPQTLVGARQLFNGVKRRTLRYARTTVVLCPPTLYIGALAHSYKGRHIHIGAQDVFWKNSGSHTGAISPFMIKSIGVQYVIVGHSERRALGETDDIVARKTRAVLKEKMRAILCVGEQKRDNAGNYLHFLERELEESLNGVSRELVKRLIVAYEPIWAIGRHAKDAVTPEDLHRMSLFVRKVLSKLYGRTVGLKIPVLYGGSVEENNAEMLLRGGAVDGFLVGHASLDAEKFSTIVSVTDTIR